MASASVPLTSITLSLGHLSSLSLRGTVLVTMTLLKHDRLIVSMAFPDRIPWVTIAMTSLALCSLRVAAALARVPPAEELDEWS